MMIHNVISAGVLVLLVVAAHAGTFSSTFNSINQPGTTLHGNSAIDRTGGVLNSGVLRLTSSEAEKQGAFVIGDLDSGRPISAFTAAFKLRIGGGSGGEGFSFNFAPDLPDEAFGEEGTGLGLTVSFDTADTGGGEGPAIDVKFRGATVASKKINARTADRFVAVEIRVDPDGTVDVTFDGSPVYSNLYAFVPLTGRFGLGARTGTLTDAHLVDDLQITTEVLTGPFVRAATPSGDNIRPNAPIRVEIQDFTRGVDEKTVRMSLNGSPVAATISKSGTVTKLQYQPADFLRPGSTNSVKVSYSDDSSPAKSHLIEFEFVVQMYSYIPAHFAVSANDLDLSVPGFKIRTVQARVDAALPPNLARAEAQIAGTLIDPTTGKPFVNEAKPGSNTDKTFHEPGVINYEKDANPSGNFLSNERHIPGLPGVEGHTVNAAMEVLGYLELPAGYHQFGVSSDDGFRVTFGEGDVRDAFSLILGQFEGNRSVGDTLFSALVESAGIYPFRLIWYQSGGGGSVEFYSVDSNGKRILINDRADPSGLKAYASRGTGALTQPYVESVDPRPDATGVSRNPEISIVLKDGQTSVLASSIRLSLNGATVPALVEQTNGSTIVRFRPSTDLKDLSVYKISLIYMDNGSPAVTTKREWSFTTARQVNVAGQWDFDSGLIATFGLGAEFGTDGNIQAAAEFGTTTEFGIPHIGDRSVRVMRYNRIEDATTTQPGFLIRHGIQPNGGGSKVNQWTLVMDVLFPDPQVSPFSSLIQLNEASTDGDLFVRWNDLAGPGTGGIGVTGQYTGNGRTSISIGKWHRVTIAVDLASSSPVISKYIDGAKFSDQSLTAPQLDGRFALDATLRLFGDDNNEVNTVYVNSVQILDGKLTGDEVAALGGPSSEGIPLAHRVMGQWDFDNGDLRAAIGHDLQFFGTTQTNALFGTTASFRIPAIQGQPANVLFIPDSAATAPNRDLGLILTHGIEPSAGHTKVNAYTLLMDLYLASTNQAGFFSFLQTDPENSSDGDLFFRASDGGIGQGEGSYEGSTRMELQRWHRIAFAVDLAAQPPVITKFIDGVKHSDWIQPDGIDLNRRALLPSAILFADENGERMPVYVNSIQIRTGKLLDQDLRALGRPTAGGIPINIPPIIAIPELSVRTENMQIVLSWPAEFSGLLESADALGATWTPVPNATGTSITVTPLPTAPVKFFRLRSP